MDKKKKILMVSKFLYPRGGDCIVALSEAELLRNAGYEVEMWGMDYPDNLPMPLADTFASRVDFGGGVADKLKAINRLMGRGDIRKSFAEVLRRVKPDVVHFHNIHSYLSPVVVEMAKAAGCRTLWTMHDYKLVCPSYSMLDPCGKACSDCITDPKAVMRKRCMKGSRLQSAMAYLEARKWNIARLSAATDCFICPCDFLARKMKEGGIPEERLATVLHFTDPIKTKALSSLPVSADREPRRILFVGRLSKEKGVVELVKALMSIPDDFILRMVGAGPLEASLREMAADDPRIQFTGWVDGATVAKEHSKAAFFISPSLWYENNTTSVMEALVAGTPAMVSSVGCQPDMLDPGSGIAFNPNSPEEIAAGVREMLGRTFDHEAIRRSALERFSAEKHLAALETLL